MAGNGLSRRTNRTLTSCMVHTLDCFLLHSCNTKPFFTVFCEPSESLLPRFPPSKLDPENLFIFTLNLVKYCHTQPHQLFKPCMFLPSNNSTYCSFPLANLMLQLVGEINAMKEMKILMLQIVPVTLRKGMMISTCLCIRLQR